jgi:hypothetical protein
MAPKQTMNNGKSADRMKRRSMVQTPRVLVSQRRS